MGERERPLEKRDKKSIRRADLILICSLLLLALGLMVWQYAARETGARAVVYVNGQRQASYPLSKDAEILLEHDNGSYNLLIIADGKADVTDAGCPDKICVHMRPIQYDGESIICLPNRLEIRIEGGEPSGVDVG